jgi:hypothetical protein
MSDDRAVWADYHEAEIKKRDERIAELEEQVGALKSLIQDVMAADVYPDGVALDNEWFARAEEALDP